MGLSVLQIQISLLPLLPHSQITVVYLIVLVSDNFDRMSEFNMVLLYNDQSKIEGRSQTWPKSVGVSAVMHMCAH